MLRLSFVLALAGCPAKKPTTPAAAGAGCPPAANVYVASYVTLEAGKGRTGWVVPLHAVAGINDAPAYANVDAAAAQAAGAPPPPSGTLWLVTSASAPCRATVGKLYAAKLESPAGLSYGVELEGCGAPANPDEGGGLALVSEQAPTGCRFEQPHPVAARLGEMDKTKRWQRPTKQTPLPPPVASAITDKECAAPACEKLWAFAEVKLEGRPVAWTGAINWLHVGAPEQQCQWAAERESGTWVATGGGAAKVTEGQEDHPLPLSALLADGDGAKVLLTEGPGVYATYDAQLGRVSNTAGTASVTAAAVKLGHKITWQLAPDEAWDAVDHLMFCEPEKH